MLCFVVPFVTIFAPNRTEKNTTNSTVSYQRDEIIIGKDSKTHNLKLEGNWNCFFYEFSAKALVINNVLCGQSGHNKFFRIRRQ